MGITPNGQVSQRVQREMVSFRGRELPVSLAKGSCTQSQVQALLTTLRNPVSQKGLAVRLGVKSADVKCVTVIPGEQQKSYFNAHNGELVTTQAEVEKLPQISWTMRLGGGTFKGFAYPGLFRFLKKIGASPSAIVTTSTGAVFGSFLAAGQDADDITAFGEHILKNFRLRDIIKPDLKGLRHFRTYDGFTSLDIMVRLMCNEGGLGTMKFADMDIPFFVTTTGINDGQGRIACDPANRTMFDSGESDGEYRQHRIKFLNDEDMSVAEAAKISASLPSIIKPTRIGNRILMDGGVADCSVVAAARIKGKDGKNQPGAGWRLGYKGQHVSGLDNVTEFHMAMLDIFMALKDEDALNSCSLDGSTFRSHTSNFFSLGMVEALQYAPELGEYMEASCERMFAPFMRKPGNPMDNYLAPWSRETIDELRNAYEMSVERDGKKPSDIISILDKRPFVPVKKSMVSAPAESKLSTMMWIAGLMKDAWGWGWTGFYAFVGWVTVTFFQKKQGPRA